MLKKFPVEGQDSQQAVAQALDFIRESIEGCRLSVKEANRAQLMAEESLVRLVEHGDFEGGGAIQVNVRRFLGAVTISLIVPGEEFDFAKGLEWGAPLAQEDMSPDTAEAIQNIRLRYSHKRGLNFIKVKAVRSRYAALYWTLGALLLAIVTGLLMKAFAPEALCAALNDAFLIPVRTVFMNGLKMCAPPVVFLSIATCIAQFGDLSEVRRLGGRLLLCFVLLQCAAAGTGLGISYLLQPGSGMEIAAASPVAAQGVAFSFKDTLINLMPSNVFRPFLEGDMFQLIVLAAFIGTATGALGAATVRAFLEECKGVFMRVTAILTRFIPLVVFCSITSAVLTAGGETLFPLLDIIGVDLLGLAAVTFICAAAVVLSARLNPARLLSGSLPMLATAFSTSSSNATIPDSMRTAQRLGIAPRLYSLSIPLGSSINKLGADVSSTVLLLALVRTYGVDISANMGVVLAASVMALEMGSSGLPGGMIIVLSSLLPQAGVPVEAVGLVMGVLPLIDMPVTAVNCFGNMTATLIVAAREGLLDRDIYDAGQADGR